MSHISASSFVSDRPLGMNKIQNFFFYRAAVPLFRQLITLFWCFDVEPNSKHHEFKCLLCTS